MGVGGARRLGEGSVAWKFEGPWNRCPGMQKRQSGRAVCELVQYEQRGSGVRPLGPGVAFILKEATR